MAHERQAAIAKEPAPNGDVSVEAWRDVFSGSALWPAGTYLCQQGNEPESTYLLQEGFVKLVCADSDGEELVVALKYAPTLLGVTAAIAGHAYTLSVVTGTQCRVRYCTLRTFLTALEGNPARLFEVARLQSLEVETLISRLLVMGLKDAKTRLVHLIRSCCPPAKDGDTAGLLHLPLKQYEIASFLGITPEHLSRVISRLARQGIVRQQDGHIVVPTRGKV